MDRIKVKLPDGGLISYDSGRWIAENDQGRMALLTANDMTADYHYSPGHGYPGAYLAKLIAEELGGEAILPKFPPLPEGAIP